MDKKELKTFSLTQEAFDMVLMDDPEFVIIVKDINDYVYGSSSKNPIFVNKARNKMVLVQKRLEILGHKAPNNWVQCICVISGNQSSAIEENISGGQAWRDMMRILLKNYTEEEVDECLKAKSVPYDAEKCQWHVNLVPNDNEKGVVHAIEKCVRYDMNGAYAKALCEIFPRSESDIKKLYMQRKSKPVNKKLCNYFVGMLCTKKHPYRETFNWIVQKVREEVERAAAQLDGIIIYANTDGFVVSGAKQKLNTSHSLGAFKEEFCGTAYVYQGENHLIIQMGDKITGTMPRALRDKVDLKQGKVVSYIRRKDGLVYVYDNVVEKRVPVKYYGC